MITMYSLYTYRKRGDFMLNMIKNAKSEEMNDILLAVQNRYQELFPGWKLHILVTENAMDKNEQINRAIALLEKMKDL